MPMLSIPEDVHRHLLARAIAENTTVEELAQRLLSLNAGTVDEVDHLIDLEFHAECEADTGPVPTLEEVRAILARIPTSLAADVITDREDR